ncbi:MAG: GatB/YqeY domain-containing protein [Patescibacteria group bacterium]
MSIKENLQSDLKISMKAGDKIKTGVLRFILSEVQSKEKEKQGQGKPAELIDEEINSVLQKEFKKRKEAIRLFKTGGREDLVSSEEAELAIIEAYIPKQLDQSEIRTIIEKLISRGRTDFASIMKEAMKEMKERADGKFVAEVIKERIKN